MALHLTTMGPSKPGAAWSHSWGGS